MRIFAHRGCPDRGPENSVAAVRRAAPHVDAVEVDVRRCGSGELVVFHDERLARGLTDPERGVAWGRVADTDWATLSSLRIAGSDARVPRFAEMVAAVDDAGLDLNVELKESGLAADVADALAEFDGDVVVSSFDFDALGEMRRVADYPLAPLVRAGALSSSESAWKRGLDAAAWLDAAAIHPSYDLLLRAPDAGARIAAAHEVGLSVNAWTVRTKRSVRDLAAAGVDGLIVDDWDVVG